MAKDKLFPPKTADDKRNPHDKFSDLASKIVTVPKSEIDKREAEWKRQRQEHDD